MKDLIAERDKKEKMEHSIVKWWNVHYMTPEELTEEQKKEASLHVSQAVQPEVNEEMYSAGDSLDAAQESIDRLNREAAEDEARKQLEIEQAKLAAEANDRKYEPKNDMILQKIAMILVPLIIIFGIYVILNGHISPGGGFSGA